MATIPNPKTWVAGTIPTASEFNIDIRDGVSFFVSPPRAHVRHNAATAAIAHSTWVRLDWNTEDTGCDPDGMHGGTTQRLIAVTAGRYWCSVHVLWSAFGTLQNGPHAVQIRKNSANNATLGQCIAYDARHAQSSIVGDLGEGFHGVNGYASLSASDYLEVFVRHGHDSPFGSDDSEVQMSTTAGVRFTAVWVGQ